MSGARFIWVLIVALFTFVAGGGLIHRWYDYEKGKSGDLEIGSKFKGLSDKPADSSKGMPAKITDAAKQAADKAATLKDTAAKEAAAKAAEEAKKQAAAKAAAAKEAAAKAAEEAKEQAAAKAAAAKEAAAKAAEEAKKQAAAKAAAAKEAAAKAAEEAKKQAAAKAAAAKEAAAKAAAAKALAFGEIKGGDKGQLTLSGKAVPNADISIFANNIHVGSTISDSKGNWSHKVTRLIPPGDVNLEVRQMAGDELVLAKVSKGFQQPDLEKMAAEKAAKEAAEKQAAAKAAAAKAAAAKALAFGEIKGADKGKLTISGKSQPDADIWIFADNVHLGSAKSDGSGNWSHQVTRLIPPGNVNFEVRHMDGYELLLAKTSKDFQMPDLEKIAAEKAAKEAAEKQAAKEAAAKAAQEAAAAKQAAAKAAAAKVFSMGEIKGADKGKLTITGKSQPGADIWIFADNIHVGSAKADGSGNWSHQVTRLIPPGDVNLEARQMASDELMLAKASKAIKLPDLTQSSKAPAAKPAVQKTSEQKAGEKINEKKGEKKGVLGKLADFFKGDKKEKTSEQVAERTSKQPRMAAEKALAIQEIMSAGPDHVHLSGTAQPNVRLLVYANGLFMGDARADNSGKWSYQLTKLLPPGENKIEIQQVEKGGLVLAKASKIYLKSEPKTPLDAKKPASASPAVVAPAQAKEPTKEPAKARVISGNQYNVETRVYSNLDKKVQKKSVTMKRSGRMGGGYYHVRPGDTLGKIARRFYGRRDYYDIIYDANKHILQHSDVLTVGQKLSIPVLIN